MDSSFIDAKNLGEILTAAPNRGGVGFELAISTYISLYLRNGAR